MNCDEALPLLYDLVDGELEENEERLLQSHLKGCMACRAELESIRAAESFYRKEMLVMTPAGLEERIVQSLEEESAARAALQPRSRLARAAILGLAASVMAGAVYLASLLPESGMVADRALELLSSLSPQWEESLRALSEISFSGVFSQLIDILTNTFRDFGSSVPAMGGFSTLIVLILIALQIVGSYRLLGENLTTDEHRQ